MNDSKLREACSAIRKLLFGAIIAAAGCVRAGPESSVDPCVIWAREPGERLVITLADSKIYLCDDGKADAAFDVRISPDVRKRFENHWTAARPINYTPAPQDWQLLIRADSPQEKIDIRIHGDENSGWVRRLFHRDHSGIVVVNDNDGLAVSRWIQSKNPSEAFIFRNTLDVLKTQADHAPGILN